MSAHVEVDQSESAIRDALAQDDIETLIITKKGKVVAALVPLSGLDLESASLSLNPDFIALIERSRQSIREKGAVPIEEVRRLLADS